MVVQKMRHPKSRIRNWLKLALCVFVVASVWLIVLPRVSSIEVVANHIKYMEDRNVRAGAMYYTDLEKIPTRPTWIEQEILLWP